MKDKMIEWFNNRQIKSNLEKYELVHEPGRINYCINYLKCHEVKEDTNLDLYCCSLYYSIYKLWPNKEIDEKGSNKYKNKIKKSWAKLEKTTAK